MSSDADKPVRKSARTLAEDERALWRLVTRTVAPLRRATRLEPEEPRESLPPEPPQRPTKSAPAIDAKQRQTAKPPLAPFDRRLKQRLSRGSEMIDARIDLHGLTQNEAHAALTRFLARAQDSGARTVLVITGKGGAERDALAERGVLRRQVPLWLKLPELRAIVLGFETAHASHGGEGALYVRLRRSRSAAREDFRDPAV